MVATVAFRCASALPGVPGEKVSREFRARLSVGALVAMVLVGWPPLDQHWLTARHRA